MATTDSDGVLQVFDRNNFVPAPFDYLESSYTDNKLTQVVYKRGGASGTVVGTLTITYDGDNIATVTRT